MHTRRRHVCVLYILDQVQLHNITVNAIAGLVTAVAERICHPSVTTEESAEIRRDTLKERGIKMAESPRTYSRYRIDATPWNSA